MKEFGCDYKTTYGDSLENIKNYRNKLAHGEISFSELSHVISQKNIVDMKKDVLGYFSEMLKKTDVALVKQFMINRQNVTDNNSRYIYIN